MFLHFPCKIATKKGADERTRTADLISSYEFACRRANPYWCVRKLRLFGRFSVIWRHHFVHCVPVRTSPVVVRVAVHAGSSIRARGEVPAPIRG